MKYLLSRLKEPSTWAAFAAMGSLFGLNPSAIQTIGGAIVALVGAVAVLVPEQAKKTERE